MSATDEASTMEELDRKVSSCGAADGKASYIDAQLAVMRRQLDSLQRQQQQQPEETPEVKPGVFKTKHASNTEEDEEPCRRYRLDSDPLLQWYEDAADDGAASMKEPCNFGAKPASEEGVDEKVHGDGAAFMKEPYIFEAKPTPQSVDERIQGEGALMEEPCIFKAKPTSEERVHEKVQGEGALMEEPCVFKAKPTSKERVDAEVFILPPEAFMMRKYFFKAGKSSPLDAAASNISSDRLGVQDKNNAIMEYELPCAEKDFLKAGKSSPYAAASKISSDRLGVQDKNNAIMEYELPCAEKDFLKAGKSSPYAAASKISSDRLGVQDKNDAIMEYELSCAEKDFLKAGRSSLYAAASKISSVRLGVQDKNDAIMEYELPCPENAFSKAGKSSLYAAASKTSSDRLGVQDKNNAIMEYELPCAGLLSLFTCFAGFFCKAKRASKTDGGQVHEEFCVNEEVYASSASTVEAKRASKTVFAHEEVQGESEWSSQKKPHMPPSSMSSMSSPVDGVTGESMLDIIVSFHPEWCEDRRSYKVFKVLTDDDCLVEITLKLKEVFFRRGPPELVFETNIRLGECDGGITRFERTLALAVREFEAMGASSPAARPRRRRRRRVPNGQQVTIGPSTRDRREGFRERAHTDCV